MGSGQGMWYNVSKNPVLRGSACTWQEMSNKQTNSKQYTVPPGEQGSGKRKVEQGELRVPGLAGTAASGIPRAGSPSGRGRAVAEIR